MKKLNLDETWRLCLKMWKDLAREIRKLIKTGEIFDIDDLKEEWLIKHKFNPDFVQSWCFFCEYNCTHLLETLGYCNCPAKKIDPSFNCMSTKYDYDTNPIGFYAKLVALNKIRLKGKKK